VTAHVAGIDAGASTVKVVVLDVRGELVTSGYRAHRGNPLATLGELLSKLVDGHPVLYTANDHFLRVLRRNFKPRSP